MENIPEQPTSQAQEPREVYSYTPTPSELAAVNRAILGNAWVGALACAILFGIVALFVFALSAPAFVYGALLGALFTVELLIWAGNRNNKKALSESTGKILANFASYRYELYEYCLTVTCYRGEDVTRFQKVFYPDIVSLRDTGEHILLQINAVEYFILRKADLLPESRFFSLLSAEKQKTEQVQAKNSAPLTVLLVLLSVVSLFVAFGIIGNTVEGTAPPVIPFAFVFFGMALFPLITLAVGIGQKARGKKGGILIGFGAAFLALLLLFGCLSLANPAMFDRYDHTDAHLLKAEAAVGIDLPSNGYHKTWLYDNTEDYYFCETVVYLTEGEAAAFEERIGTLPFKTGKALTELEETEDLYTSWYDGLDLTYYLYYNADTKEFNRAAESGKTFRYFDIGYDPRANALYILEYAVEFYAEDLAW